MKLQHLRAITAPWLLPAVTAALAAAIFIGDTIADLEIAFPAFYTVVVLMSVRFCKRRAVILVGAGCIGLTLLSDLLTAATGSSGIGVINTTISILAIAITTYLALKIESEKEAAYEARSQLAHVGRVTTLGELTASIAHEVNQPLAAAVINGNACLRWLADEPPNLDEARQAVTRLVKDANRASEIIAQVRALTKSSPPQKDWLAINDIILATVSLIDSEILQNNVSLRTELADDVPPVQGDRVQLQQVILNLILNALEAMSRIPEGSRLLTISSARIDAKGALVTVQDSGVGLAPENLDRAFSAFYTTKPEGMGMGLAISRSIVEAHGGRIWATPNSPRGAVFQFILPVGRGIVSEPSPIVFVIDDSPAVREALDSLIRSIHLNVRTFGSTEEFLQFKRPDAPGCLVLDVRLPGLSGLDFQNEMTKSNIELPVIFITGHGDVPMSVRALKAGAIEFLPKPFRDQDLLDAIHDGIARDRARRQAAAIAGVVRGHFASLTSREREVMQRVVSGRPNKQIAAELKLSEVTVKVHRRHVMRKMKAKSLADLVRMADKLLDGAETA